MIPTRHVGKAWRSAGSSSRTWRLKKVMLSLLVVGSLSFLTYGGAFALMTGDLVNRGSSVASGTITFSNQVNTGTVCVSNSGPASPGNVNTACDALFTSATQMYPGQLATAKVTIKNTGSIGANDLAVFMPSCAAAATPGAPVTTGDPCAAGGAQFYIQETNASWVASKCWFPTTVTTCPLNADSLNTFDQNYTDTTSMVHLGAGPAAAQLRYFIIGMELPAAAANTLQGREAVFALTWHVST
jgi:hypothetical protein